MYIVQFIISPPCSRPYTVNYGRIPIYAPFLLRLCDFVNLLVLILLVHKMKKANFCGYILEIKNNFVFPNSQKRGQETRFKISSLLCSKYRGPYSQMCPCSNYVNHELRLTNSMYVKLIYITPSYVYCDCLTTLCITLHNL